MADFGDILNNISIGAGQSVRRNAGDSAFEAFTPGSGGGAVWGTVTGTLSDQTDLQTALNAKLSTTPPGSNKQVLFNNSGVYGATAALTIDSSTIVRLNSATLDVYNGTDHVHRLSNSGSTHFGNTSAGNGRIGFGQVTSPTARIHIGAGRSTENGAPLKIDSGTLLTTPEANAIEYDGTSMYYSNSSAARKQLATTDDVASKKTDSMDTNKLLGRGTAGTGVIEEITLGTNLSLTGTTLNASGGGMADPGSNGILARTALDTTVARTITGTANQITVTDGDGVAGNPTLSTPQNIHTGASPTFAGLTATGTVTAGNMTSPDSVATGTERFGAGATATGQNSTAFGSAASGTATNSVVIGRSSTDGGNSGAVCLGFGAISTGANSFSLGRAATAAIQAIAIGFNANAGFNSSMAFGRASATTAANQFVAGATTYTITNVFFGSGVTDAAPVGFTLNGTGGSGTDIAGANLTIAGGRGTGSGAGGSILFQTTPAGASGSTLRTLTTRMTIDATGLVTVAGNLAVSDEAYGGSWDGSSNVPTKNAIYDKIEAIPALTDGDKGDITVSGSGTTWTIDNEVVTNAKSANMATKTYKGRTSGGTGVPEDVAVATLKTDLELVKGDVGLGNVDNTSDATKNSATATLTNKRVQPRTSTAASGDITPDLSTANIWQRTAISATIAINAPTGSPVLGEVLVFMLLDNGSTRTLNWNAAFTTRPMGAALPTATTAGKQLLVTAQYNGSTWLALSVEQT
jgi:hypothetical protein